MATNRVRLTSGGGPAVRLLSRDTTDIQTDYFNVTYFAFVQVEDAEHAELRARESAQAKAARDRKAA